MYNRKKPHLNLSGSLPGRFAVSKIGAATYEIPLMVPPGSGGLAPDLSLQYNSQRGDGLLGVGWILSGLSKITRCPRNIAQDGYVSSVNYSQVAGQCDQFSLDGLRLVAVKGPYGADKTEYRTDPETFTKVISYGSDGYGPLYFKAWTKSGQVIEYGGNAASVDADVHTTDATNTVYPDASTVEGRIKRVIYSGPAATRAGVRVWAASKISDRTGKYMRIVYQQDQFDTGPGSTGSYWPAAIWYTGNDTLGRVPYNLIEFVYEPRPAQHAIPFYESGARIQLANRLSAINTYENGNLVLQYQVRYDTDPTITRSRIVSVAETDASLGNSLPPTTFKWQDDPVAEGTDPPLLSNPNTFDLITPASSAANLYCPTGLENAAWTIPGNLNPNVYGENVRLGADVNGDGRGDLVVVYEEDSRAVANALIYDPVGAVFGEANGIATFPSQISMPSDLGPWDNNGFTRYLTMDVTGDGKTDIVVIHYDEVRDVTIALVYAANSQSGFDFLSSTDLLAGNFLVPDVVYFQAANLNGDGRDDLLAFRTQPTTGGYAEPGREVLCWLSNGVGFDSYSLNLTIDINGDPQRLGQYAEGTVKQFTADLTGNGLTDIVWVQAGQAVGITVFLCTPSSDPYDGQPKFVQVPSSGFPTLFSSNARPSAFYVFPMDVNGDGNDDIVIIGPSGFNSALYTFLSDGQGGFQIDLSTSASQTLHAGFYDIAGHPQSYQQFSPADFNGDGRTDFVYLYMDGATAMAELWQADYATPGKVFTQIPLPSSVNAGAIVGSGPNTPAGVYLPVDVTGDGKADLVRIAGITGTVIDVPYQSDSASGVTYFMDIAVEQAWISAFASLGAIPNMITRITDGCGLQTDISYLPATSGDVYLGATGALADSATRNWQAAKYLVSSYTTSDGLGGAYEHDYQYSGAKMHVSYGFLGFERTTEIQPASNLKIETTYYQPYPMTGMVSTITRSVADTQVYLRTDIVSVTSLGNRSYAHVDSRREIVTEFNNGSALRDSTSQFQYDAYGSVVSSTIGWASGTETVVQQYVNDGVGWLLALPLSTSITKTAPFQFTQTHQTKRTFDPTSGLLLTETLEWNLGALFRTAQYTYDADGNLTQAVSSGSDFGPRTTTTTYDSQGRFPLSTTNAVGHVETRTYESGFGGITSSADPNGVSTYRTYDGFGRPSTESRPDSSVVTWQYLASDVNTPTNSTHLVDVQTTGAAGVTTYMDALGRTIRTAKDGFLGTTVFVDTLYNSLGQLIQRTAPYYSTEAPSQFQYQFDPVGRVIAETGPDGTQVVTTFLGSATPLSTTLNLNAGDAAAAIRTDADGNAVQTLTDSQGHVIQTQNIDATGTLQAYASYEYDSLGHPTKIEGPTGIIVRMDYDAPGRRVTLEDADLGTRTFQHNMANEMVSMSTPAGISSMTYDAIGRLTNRNEPEGPTTWLYDDPLSGAVNKLSAVAYPPGGFLESYQYNGISQLAQVNTTSGAKNFQTMYQYDNNSLVSQITYPGPSFGIQNIYDAAGYLLEVIDAATGASYWTAETRDAAGTVTRQMFGNGVECGVLLDPYERPLEIAAWNGSGPLQLLYYQYDLDKLTQRLNSLLLPNVTENFQFDSLGRLTSSGCSYDPAGNLLFKSDVGHDYTYTSCSHQVNFIYPATNFAYDASGNMTGSNLIGSRKVAWNSFAKPSEINQSGLNAVQMNFTYNQDRQKATQIVNVSGAGAYVLSTWFVGRLYEHDEWTGSWAGISDRRYIFADANVVAVHSPGTGAIYVHQDVLGSVDVVTGATGNAIERDSFDPHGMPRNPNWTAGTPSPSNPQLGNYGFTGHKTLALVGLVDMGGRMYDPFLGRFLSPDPYIPNCLNPQSLNRYSYVDNNPVSRIDPTGFQDGPIGPTDPTADQIRARYLHDKIFSEGVDITAWKFIRPDDRGDVDNRESITIPMARSAAAERAAILRDMEFRESRHWGPDPERGLVLDNTLFIGGSLALTKLAGLAEAYESAEEIASGNGTWGNVAQIVFAAYGLKGEVGITSAKEFLADRGQAIISDFLGRYSLGLEGGAHPPGSLSAGWSLSAAPPDNTRVVIASHPVQIDVWKAQYR